MIERPSPRLLAQGGAPLTWVGTNFLSRAGGPRMWSTFDPGTVAEELDVLARHGLNVTRSFFFLPDFMPSPYAIDEACVERFAHFLDLSAEAGLGTIPTFVVGHMSGENWDVAWRQGRELYMSNEMPLYGGSTRAEYGRSWAELLIQAIRGAGARQPASTGDGAWGIETTGHDNGFRLRDLEHTVDFVGPHVYPMSDDAVGQHLTAAFTCELCQVGRPVVLEELGCMTDFASPDNAGDYHRQVLHTSLLGGAVGWIPWNNTDFDLVDQDPYRHHPFELHSGVNGTPKPPLMELQRFRRLLDRVDLPACRRAPTDTAIVVSSYLDTDYPFFPQEERQTIRDAVFEAYIAGREADLNPALVRELDGLPEARLLIVPSVKALTAPTWRALESRACAGATVYVSFSSGATSVQRGPWCPNLDALFGVEHRLRYGLLERVDEDLVTWRLTSALGDLSAGDELSFRTAGTVHGRAMLPVALPELGSARVLATGGRGRPALLLRQVGAGALVLATYPVEYFAASLPNANPESSWRLYSALGAEADIEQMVRSDRPELLVDSLVHSGGARYAWLVSGSERPLSAPIRLSRGGGLEDLESGERLDTRVELAPYGVRVFRLITGAPT